MSLSEQERRDIVARFQAEFGYLPEDIFSNTTLVKGDFFLSWMQEILDNSDKCKPVKAIFGGADRNKNLRRYGSVEYRCHRGCLLGALVKFKGEYFMFTEQAVAVNEYAIDWNSIDRTLEGRGGAYVPPEFEDLLVESMQEFGTTEGFPVYTLSDFLAFAPSIVSNSCWDCRVFRETSFYNMNCRHSELNLGGYTVLEDAQKMARKSKRVIRVTPQD